MKKFLTGLLTLSLIAGAGMAWPSGQVRGTEGGVVNGVESGVVNGVESGVVENKYEPSFQITMLRPEDGNMRFAANTEGTDLYLRRVVLAYYNYEDGVTEVEADAKIAELGVNDELGWGTMVYDFAFGAFTKKPEFTGGMTVTSEDGMPESLRLAEVNKTDVLYYAAEFGERTGEGVAATWSNLSWLRGKIDYRDCIHGSNYTNYGECKVVHETDAPVVNYWTYGRAPAADQHIMTWNEEWQAIQKGRLEEVEDRIEEWEGLADFATVAEGLVTGIRQDLDKLKITLAKTEGEGADDLRDWRDELEKRLNKLQGIEEPVEETKPSDKPIEEEKPTGSDKPAGDDKPAGNDKPMGNGGSTESDNVSSEGDNEGADNKITENVQLVESKSEEIAQQAENGELSKQLAMRINIALKGTGQNGSSSTAGAAQDEAAQGEQAENAGEAKDGAGEQEVEVPNLGDEEQQEILWALWLPILAGLLLLILIVARKIRQKIKNYRYEQ